MINEYEYFHYIPTRQKQIKRLENNASPAQRPHIKKAFDYVVIKNKITKKDDADEVIGKIFSLAEEFARSGSTDIIRDFFESYIISNETIKEILPSIKKLRQEFFSKEIPPFPNNPQKAFAWLKEEEEKEAHPFRQNIEKNRKKIDELRNEILNKIGEYKNLTNIRCEFSRKSRVLSYPGEGGSKKIIQVWEGTLLARLEEKTRKLSEKAGFTQESMILFVLTGIKPVSLHYSISVASRFIDGEFVRKKVTLHINRPLTKKTSEKIRSRIKQIFGMERKSFLKEKHSDLCDLVEKHGGSPKQNKGDFWQKIKKEINEKYPNWFNDLKANGPRITYNRIKKHIQILNKVPTL